MVAKSNTRRSPEYVMKADFNYVKDILELFQDIDMTYLVSKNGETIFLTTTTLYQDLSVGYEYKFELYNTETNVTKLFNVIKLTFNQEDFNSLYAKMNNKLMNLLK
jgi:hypothetical protein